MAQGVAGSNPVTRPVSRGGESMPVYEFQCKKCSEVFEVKCRVEEYSKLKPTCPKCKSEEVERKISTFYAQTESKT